MVYTYDIVIVGAGPAGVTAAVTSARLGSKVALISNRPVLGGNSSSEIRIWARGATGGGNLFSEEMGIWGDFKLRNLFVNQIGNPIFWDDILLEHVLQEENIELFLNTNISSICKNSDGSIKSVFGIQQMSEQHITFEGNMFIDCTGDSTIGALSGIPYTVGKEAEEDYNESYAPTKRSTETLGSSIIFYTKKLNQKVEFTPPSYAYDIEYIEDIIHRGGRVVHEDYHGSDYWWFEYGGVLDTISDNQKISLEIRKLVYGIWNYIKNSGKYNVDNLTLEWLGSIPGKRESRRMITDYVLNQDDLLKNKSFEDNAFYGGWYMDFHPSNGIYATEENCKQVPVNVYNIPLRTLYNSSVKNLMFAGRNIGTTHVAFSSSRIMNTCALSGQAAATVASYCINKNINLQGLKHSNILDIQSQLSKDDMWILGYKNSDDKDLVNAGKVSVSSVVSCKNEVESDSYNLENGGFIVYPHTSKSSTQILFNSKKSTKLLISVFLTTVPSRYKYGEKLSEFSIEIPEGKTWVTIPEEIYGKDNLITLCIEANPSVSIITSKNEITGVIGGNSEEYEYFNPCIRLGGNHFYNQKSLSNGFNRLYKLPNLWIAGEENNPKISIKWDEKKPVSEIRLYFNPDLSKEIPSSKASHWADSHKFLARNGKPPQLVKDFSVYAKQSSSWTLIADKTENWKRMAVVKLDNTILTEEIKIVINSTYGSPAEVFEVRIY